jgi:hypothetical protein
MMGEREPKIGELNAENQQLRAAVASLAAALLRDAAADSVARESVQTPDAERLVREAEECFRCARLPDLRPEIAEGLEIAGCELMAKAVEIESSRQREKRKSQSM